MELRLATVCTVHDGYGGRCGVTAQCTRVVTLNGDGATLHDHQVCPDHRRQMGLPDHDVVMTPSGNYRPEAGDSFDT